MLQLDVYCFNIKFLQLFYFKHVKTKLLLKIVFRILQLLDTIEIINVLIKIWHVV